MLISNVKLKQLRKDRGWSQELLAKTSGLALRSVQRIETSGRASPESILAICATLDITPSDLDSSKSQIEVSWTRKEIMQGIIIIALFISSIGSLFFLASEPLHYIDIPSVFFTYCFMLLFTALAFGVQGLTSSLAGIRYLFTQEFAGGKQAEFLARVYQSQIKFCYGAAVILFLIGLIALIRTSATQTEVQGLYTMLELSVPVTFMPFLYAAILAEGILRPLKIKLQSCDLSL